MASVHNRDRQMTHSMDHLIHEEIPKETDEESTCPDQDEDIDELDPFSDFED